MRYRADIDGLRAIAVLPVLLFHAFPVRLPGGFIGVDVFFVISGYLITKIIDTEIQRNTFSYLKFYIRRIARLFPALLTVLTATLFLAWFIQPAEEFESLGKSLVASLLFIQNYNLYLESGYFDISSELKPLLHLWSLSVEEQYYIIWPSLMLIIYGLALNVRRAIIIITLISFFYCLYLSYRDNSLAFFGIPTRAWELGFGSYLAISRDSLEKAILKGSWLFNIGYGLIIAAFIYALTAYNGDNYPSYFAVIPVLFASFVIIGGPSCWINRWVLSSRFLVSIGLISYPLYLWHYPIITISRMHFSDGIAFHHMLLLLVFAIILSYLTYKFIEQPLRVRSANNIRYILLQIIVAGGGVVFGIAMIATQGIPSRIPDELKPFLVRGSDTSKHWRRGECLLLPDQDYRNFAPDCLIYKPNTRTLLLWGDSHAAALVPGFREIASNNLINLGQLTSSACPPLIGYDHPDRPHCASNNSYVYEEIRRVEPHTVILHSTWLYDDGIINAYLPDTIAKLKSANVKQIIILGQVPSWRGGGLPADAINYYYTHGFETLPLYSKYMLRESLAEKLLKSIATNSKVGFISAKDIMCTEKGCLTRVSLVADEPTAYDSAHLTVSGSKFLSNKIYEALHN